MRLTNRLYFEQVEQMLAEGQQVQIRMKGHSMRPLLRDGHDSILLIPYTDQPLARGDLVLFRYGGHHILHRIVRREGDRFTLAGDGNYRIEEHCSRADIVAQATAVIRRSGRRLDFTTRRWRLLSRCWTALPSYLRRITLGVLWRLGYK